MSNLNDGATNPSFVNHNPSTCPFCKEDKPGNAKNDLVNSSGTLRTNTRAGDVLGLAEPIANPKWVITYTHPQTQVSDKSPIRSNPHHCIPGNASLKGHPILDFMEASKKVNADVGYDINKQENGVWLPTIPEHFYYKAAGVTIRWGQLSKQYPHEQFTMAEAAMYQAERQFHDAHPEYSAEVKKQLDSIHLMIGAGQVMCPEASGKPKPEPPYSVIGMLDGLSQEMAEMLEGKPDTWVFPYFTSRHAKALQEKLAKAAP